MQSLIVSPGKRGLIVLAVIPPTVLQNLNMTIANIAIPHIQGGLSAGTHEVGWVLTSYIVSSAVALPLVGYLGARFGARWLLVASVLGFGLASFGCAASQTLTQLVVFRCIQGAFGAAFIPMSQSILLDIYPREKYSSAMAMWGIGVMVAPVFGPLLGAYLTDHFTWRAIFFINLPLAIAALAAILAIVPNDHGLSKKPLDLVGYVLLAVAIGLLQMTIDQGEYRGWFDSRNTVVELTAALLLLYLFVVHILTKQSVFLEPELFRDRNFSVALVLNFAIGGIFFASLALLPLFLQKIVGYPVVAAGVLLIPRGLGLLAGMLIASRLPAESDPRIPAMGGMFLVFLSLMEMAAFTGAIGHWPVIHTGLLQGCGLGILYVVLTTTAFATLKPRLRSEGAALFSLVRSVGSSFATGALFAFLVRNQRVNYSELSSRITPVDIAQKAISQDFRLQDMTSLALLESKISYSASSISMGNAFLIMMWGTLALLPLVLTLRKPNDTR